EDRDREDCPIQFLGSAVVLGPSVVGVREDIVNVHSAALQNGSSRRRALILTDRIPLHDFDEFRQAAIAGHDTINLPILPVNEAPVGATEWDRVLQQAFQHELGIERRAADYLEDLVGRRLLLQCLREFLFQLGTRVANGANARYRLRFDRMSLAVANFVFLTMPTQSRPSFGAQRES